MPGHQLSEVFGFPFDNLSERAERYRNMTLCPFNNRVPSCTKNSVQDPLGVCSIFEADGRVITCPIRFREDWRIIEDAARFFFPPGPPGSKFTSLSEVRLKDAEGGTAGDIDFVLVSLDDQGQIQDFGALEVQSVYISGNVTNPFEHYMAHRRESPDFDWSARVRADHASSLQKSLLPQLVYKGRILSEWGIKIAVALQDSFWATLPQLPAARPEEADIAWFSYDLTPVDGKDLCHLVPKEVTYTRFGPALSALPAPRAGRVEDFVAGLQDRFDRAGFVCPQ
jgi:hypothetical protein